MVQRGNNGTPKKSSEARDALAGSRILTNVAKGLTIKDAAKLAGVSEKHGRELYARELAAATEQNNGLRQQLVSRDLETIRLLIQAHMPAAVGCYEMDPQDGLVMIKPPSDASAKVVLAALDRQSKLLGLDAAIKVEVSNARVSEVVDGVVELVDGLVGDELPDVPEEGMQEAG